jgi:hypothetical protein
VKVGDKVLFLECRGTKVVLDNKEYVLFGVGDILGKCLNWNKSPLTWHHVKLPIPLRFWNLSWCKWY